jgi:transcriptional regulator with XRE-family HTH domain
MGASPATVLNWEKGQSEPAAANMPAIAQFLGYSPPTASRSVPALLAAKRRELGWTQKTAANRLGVDPSTWGGWERGQVLLRKDYREMVAQFIGVPAITLGKEMKARWNHFHQKPTGPGL